MLGVTEGIPDGVKEGSVLIDGIFDGAVLGANDGKFEGDTLGTNEG